MANATSTFLQGANAANAAMSSAATPFSSAAPVDTAQVLAAISKPEVSNIETLAASLNLSVGSVEPVVEILSAEHLIDQTDHGLQLSDAGERALRYTEISKLP